MLLNLKIGRNIYEITEADRFLDNGACIQLITQSKERVSWGHQQQPTLSKRAAREIDAFKRVYFSHHYGDGCKLFSLRGAV